MPDGASVVILIEFCNKPIGNVGVAVVESHSLKSLCGVTFDKSSIIFSKTVNQSVDRCTLASNTQLPFSTPSLNAYAAISYYPYPSATIDKRSWYLHSFAKLISIAVGSVPYDNIKMRGVVGEASNSAYFRSNAGGTVKLYNGVFKLFFT